MSVAIEPGVRAVIFDWAGTIVDHGSRAPLEAFRRTFEEIGLRLTDEEIRGPMGLGKREHIAALLGLPRIAACHREMRGTDADDAVIDRLYVRFEELQPEIAASRALPIVGVPDLLGRLRAEGIRTGGTTGFSRHVMASVLPAASANGVSLDASVCVDEVERGRPAPDMLLECAARLGVEPAACVVFDDTPVGIEAAVAAGMTGWGVSMSGNQCGFDADETAALTDIDRAEIHARAVDAFAGVGAVGTLDSVADLHVQG